MIASGWSSVAVWGLGFISVVGLVVVFGNSAVGVVRARKSQTPLGSHDRIAVACTTGSTNIPYLLFTASPSRLELKSMAPMGSFNVGVNKDRPHKIRIESRVGYTLVKDDVNRFEAAIFSPLRAAQLEWLLRVWGWLPSADESEPT